MNCKITIYGPVSKIEGSVPVQAIREATSYPVDGAEFSDAFKKGFWDGRKHLYNARSDTFPTGLLSTVEAVCAERGISVEVEDQRTPPVPMEDGFDLEGISFSYPYDYQLDACQKMVEAKQGLVKVVTGGGKTEIACAVTKHLGLKTLFVVTTVELLYQAQKRFMKRLNLTEAEVGIVGDGKWQPGSWITIATNATLVSRADRQTCQSLLQEAEVLFFDECHHLGSETWYDIALLCPASYRFGLSGTPLDRSDGGNLRLIAATGDVVVDVGYKMLVERGVLAASTIIFDKITEPQLKRRTRYPTAYKEGVVENEQLTQRVVEWAEVFNKAGLSTLILVEHIKHGELIDNALWQASEFIPHTFISGKESSDDRFNALDDFGNRRLQCLVASTILDEGVDVPTIDALIVAGSRKSRIRTMQRLGRGLRGDKLIVVEFANYCHKKLLEHSLTRLNDYRKEDCFTIKQSSPNLDLVKHLWQTMGK